MNNQIEEDFKFFHKCLDTLFSTEGFQFKLHDIEEFEKFGKTGRIRLQISSEDYYFDSRGKKINDPWEDVVEACSPISQDEVKAILLDIAKALKINIGKYKNNSQPSLTR